MDESMLKYCGGWPEDIETYVTMEIKAAEMNWGGGGGA